MKPTKYIIILFASMIVFTCSTQAQKGRIERANLLYEYQSFAEAIPKYKKCLRKDSNNKEVLIKLADCYRRVNDVDNAAKYYGKIIEKGYAESIHKYHYAQALMSIDKNADAKKYMEEYNVDKRGKTFVKSIDYFERFYKDSADYKIQVVSFNSKQNDFSPRILENKIVFASSRKRAYAENHINTWTNYSYFKLFHTKQKKNGKFSCVRPLKHAIDNRFNSGPCSFSRQERVIYLTRNNIVDTRPVRAEDGQVKLHIYAANLNKKGTSYQYLRDFIYNNKEYNCMHPAITDDGKRLYFSSDMPGGNGGYDLYYCSREGESWSLPKNLKAINTEGDETFPFIKNRILYFSSNGLEGMGGIDVYKVALDQTGIPGGNARNIGYPINSPGDDFGIVFNDDNTKGYFTSNRKSLNFNDDIYGFTFNAIDKMDILITGVTTDKESGEIVPGTTVKLFNPDNTVLEEVVVNENGNFVFLAQPNLEYTIKGEKNEYFATEKNVSTVTEVKTDEIKTDLGLDKDPGLKLRIEVKDSKTNEPLSNVAIELTDKGDGEKYKFFTSNTGAYEDLMKNKKVGNIINYDIKYSKYGYYNSKNTFTFNITEKGTVTITQNLDKIQEIEPIYFDYDKYDIRPDAAVKLDNLAELMHENPSLYIELYSYTDCRGSEIYNKDLSGKRAQSTGQYLIDKGISPGRIVGKGKGISKMAMECDCKKLGKSNCTEEQYQLNRRSEFVVKY